MSKCNICGVEQVKVGESTISICGQDMTMAHYNINIMTYIKGKCICDNCMDTYHKIHAMETGIDFSCGGREYYADGINLE